MDRIDLLKNVIAKIKFYSILKIFLKNNNFTLVQHSISGVIKKDYCKKRKKKDITYQENYKTIEKI